MRISILLLFASVISCTTHGQEISSGFQKISTGALWYEYQHVESSSITIVFESGAMSYSAYWDGVFDTIGQHWSAIRYDRAGLGSSPSSQSSFRSADVIASELNELLDSLQVQDEIVLICHSMGGHYGLAYANTFLDKVRAVTLIETPCIEWEQLLRGSLTVEQNHERDSSIKYNRAAMSAPMAQEYAAAEVNRKLLSQMSQLDIPVYVISGRDHQWPESYNHHLLDSNWLECQKRFQSLSKQVEQMVVPNTGHHVLGQFDLLTFLTNRLD